MSLPSGALLAGLGWCEGEGPSFRYLMESVRDFHLGLHSATRPLTTRGICRRTSVLLT